MIEQALAELTAAVKANTEALHAILAAGGEAPNNVVAMPAEEAKPAKKTKVKAEEPAAPAPDPVEETEPELPGVTGEPKHTVVEAIEAVKALLAKDRDGYKPKLATLRAKYGVETVKDLAADQVDAFMADLAKL